MLQRAWNMGASDLHLAVGYYPMVRVDGGLQILPVPQKSQYLPLGEGIKVAEASVAYGYKLKEEELTEYLEQIARLEHLKKLEKYGEVDFALMVAKKIRCRVNVYKSHNAPSFSVRFMRQSVPSCEELGLPETVQNFIMAKNGLILVTGPTGSGKSTTLAALLQKLNSEQRKHIITLEEPIEYIYPQGLSIISQREIGQDTQSFASGLHSALREDPDIELARLIQFNA